MSMQEAFRHHSYLSDKAIGVICGLGAKGYRFALDYAIEKFNHLTQTSLGIVAHGYPQN